jgi:hypothetical protein
MTRDVLADYVNDSLCPTNPAAIQFLQYFFNSAGRKSNDSKVRSAFALHTAEKTRFAVELNVRPPLMST